MAPRSARSTRRLSMVSTTCLSVTKTATTAARGSRLDRLSAVRFGCSSLTEDPYSGNFARENRDVESQGENRKSGTKALRVVDEFDFLVLGVGLGAIPYVCRELIER